MNYEMIMFEGISGTGKSTLVELLCQDLKTRKIEYHKIDHDGPSNPFKVLGNELLIPDFSKYCLRKWGTFLSDKTDSVWICDSCLFPYVVNTMVFADASEGVILKTIEEIFQILKGYSPLMIYCYQDNIEKTFDRLIQSRDSHWVDQNTKAIIEGPFGQRVKSGKYETALAFVMEVERVSKLALKDPDIDIVQINTTSGDFSNIYLDIQKRIFFNSWED